MAKDGVYFLVPVAAAAVVALLAGWGLAAGALGALALFIGFFFRDPARSIPSDPGIVVSPADGRVVQIERGNDATRISVFLSLFNVHINRSPIRGRITGMHYRKGRFRAAFSESASVENERNTLVIEGDGLQVECSQIAGVLARRIVCWRQSGDTLERGERFGLIRFGSRTDIRVPQEVEILVQVGDKLQGGASIIGRVAPGSIP